MRHSVPPRRTGSAAASRIRGFVLIEVMVALLIFSVGVLGIVGLQTAMTKAQTTSKMRTEAAYLAQEFIGAMWSDSTNIQKYTDCANYQRCSAIRDKVIANLPSGKVEIKSDAGGGQADVTIKWTPPGEDEHKYMTGTQVRT